MDQRRSWCCYEGRMSYDIESIHSINMANIIQDHLQYDVERVPIF